MSNSKEIDQHILNALNKLPLIMINNKGKKVCLRKSGKRGETGKEHIANISHGLQVKDVKQIPKILINPIASGLDPKHKYRKIYYGKKYKNYKFYCYIKIVTQLNDDQSEEIVTVYLSDKIIM